MCVRGSSYCAQHTTQHHETGCDRIRHRVDRSVQTGECRSVGSRRPAGKPGRIRSTTRTKRGVSGPAEGTDRYRRGPEAGAGRARRPAEAAVPARPRRRYAERAAERRPRWRRRVRNCNTSPERGRSRPCEPDNRLHSRRDPRPLTPSGASLHAPSRTPYRTPSQRARCRRETSRRAQRARTRGRRSARSLSLRAQRRAAERPGESGGSDARSVGSMTVRINSCCAGWFSASHQGRSA